MIILYDSLVIVNVYDHITNFTITLLLLLYACYYSSFGFIQNHLFYQTFEVRISFCSALEINVSAYTQCQALQHFRFCRRSDLFSSASVAINACRCFGGVGSFSDVELLDSWHCLDLPK